VGHVKCRVGGGQWRVRGARVVCGGAEGASCVNRAQPKGPDAGGQSPGKCVVEGGPDHV